MLPAIANASCYHPGLKQLQAARRAQLEIATTADQSVDATRTSGATQGLARNVAREEALSAERPQALTPQHVGPAREAARSEALGLKQLNGFDLGAYYQDLMSGMQAGPKTASALAAETRYLEARKVI